MNSFQKVYRYTGLAVFIISFIVFALTAERTGSLWDCGEFILGSYKLQVVHPPGAAIFVLIGRLFTWVAEIVSNDPADIAFAVNLMSSLFTAMMAGLVSWITMLFGKLLFIGRKSNDTLTSPELLVLGGAGLVGGLTSAFCTSVWFSAVEGEVYAMSTFFTALTFWAAVKWYSLPDSKSADRWLVFAAFSGGLSIGVHLLSILTYPAIALLYYYKKYKKHTILGTLISLAIGVMAIVFVMKIVIVGIAALWLNMELLMVNSFGLPYHTGIIPVILLVSALFYFVFKYAHKHRKHSLQIITMAALMTVVAFSTLGVVVIRANADTPVNMNVPSDAMRLLPYLNREQYGERPLLNGPHYGAQPSNLARTDRYGQLNGKYEYTEEKFDYEYKGSDKIFFPRIGHTDGGRPALHKQWRKYLNGGKEAKGKPGQAYNLGFMWEYQIKWMYFRYFMWNFTGRQNSDQGFYPWDLKKGHWASGIGFIDNARLYDASDFPDVLKSKANNKYYFVPFILGLIGLFFHFFRRKKEFMPLLVLFLITGMGIIIYSNQPPNEPRERDYVLAGSFITFAIWVGLGALAIYSLLISKAKMNGMLPAAIAIGLSVTAPALMLWQNWDDHDRSEQYGARDFAANFLNSCEPNSIIFTYGDNDTYPLWYAQEVENIRRDVRVVNLSLITVDWYIDKLRSKVNDSPPINMFFNEDDLRGKKRNQLFFFDRNNRDANRPTDIFSEFSNIKKDASIVKGRRKSEPDQYTMRTRNLYIPITKHRALNSGVVNPSDTGRIVDRIDIKFSPSSNYITKDELAIMDIIASNIHDRPVYFAVTCNPEKLLGLGDYMQLEGLGLRVIPVKSKSDKNLYIYGSGRVDTDKLYENVMNKWKWGNFDKVESHVSPSYGAGLQAMKMVILRAAADLAGRKDFEKAGNLAERYFEGFPAFNYKYDTSIFPFIDILITSGRVDKGKDHLRKFAQTMADQLAFYEGLDDKEFYSFRDDFSMAVRGADEVVRILPKVNDEAFKKEMTDLVGQYDLSKVKQR